MRILIQRLRRAGTMALIVALTSSSFPAYAGAGTCPGGQAPPCPSPTPQRQGPAHPHRPVSGQYVGPKPGDSQSVRKPPPTFIAAKKQTHVPVSPGPTRTSANPTGAPNKRGIIFVGGHAPSSASKAALTPQPIPPGHAQTNSTFTPHPQSIAPRPAPHAH
jgi:hypothetical protein